MRTKKDFIFDEKSEAKKIINNGFENNKIDYGKMYLVAKYIKDKNNYGALRLEKELIKFCTDADKEFNPITQRDYIKKWVKSAMEYSLREINEVYISKKDVEFLKTIEQEKERKILFATLIIAKALKVSGTRRKERQYEKSNRHYIKYNNLSDIARISGIQNTTEIDVAKLFHKYIELFDIYPPEKELLGVKFVDKEGSNNIRISNFDNVSEEYATIFGEEPPTFICSKCGGKFEKTGNWQIYCKKCGKEVNDERRNAAKREKRYKSTRNGNILN